MRWICPHCQHTLQLNAEHKNYRCENNHCFDIAKEGYINLMSANQKKSQNPGDNKAMVQARKQFLAAGFYQNLADKLAEITAQYSPDTNAQILEVGSGEGYYLREINRLFNAKNPKHTAVFSGLDISKDAVKTAAKMSPLQFYSVPAVFICR